MPIISVTTTHGKSAQFKDAVFDALQTALSQVGVPRDNKFHRFIELAPEDFRFGSQFPDAQRPRDNDFLLIEVIWSTGRTVAMKRDLLKTLARSLETIGIHPENMMVYFQETAWENWACAGGRLTHA